MEQNKRIMINKSGFSYVVMCVILIFAFMLIAVGMQYMCIFQTVKSQKKAVQLTLDSVVTKSATAYYDALKQGTTYGDHIDREQLIRDAYAELGFSNDAIEQLGQEACTMKRPQIEAIDSGGFGVTVTYQLIVPFEVFGEVIANIEVPVSLSAIFKEK